MLAIAKIYFLVFGLLTIAGGILGYVKAGSLVSLVAGAVSGVLLLGAALLLPQHLASGLFLAGLVSLALAIQFLPKAIRPGKLMPAGLMSLLSVVGLCLALAAWLRK